MESSYFSPSPERLVQTSLRISATDEMLDINQTFSRSIILKNNEILDCKTEGNVIKFVEKFKMLSSPSSPLQVAFKNLIDILTNILASEESNSCGATYYGVKQCLEYIVLNTGIEIDNNDVNILISMCINPDDKSGKANYTEIVKKVFEQLKIDMGIQFQDLGIYNNLLAKLKMKSTDASLFQTVFSNLASDKANVGRLYSTERRKLPPTPAITLVSNSAATILDTPISTTTTSTSIMTTISTTSVNMSKQEVRIRRESTPARPRTAPALPSASPRLVASVNNIKPDKAPEIYLPDFFGSDFEQSCLNKKMLLKNKNIKEDLKFYETSDSAIQGSKVKNFALLISELPTEKQLEFICLLDIFHNVLKDNQTRIVCYLYGLEVCLTQIIGNKLTDEHVYLFLAMCIHETKKISGVAKSALTNEGYTKMAQYLIDQAKLSTKLEPLKKPVKIDKIISEELPKKNNIFDLLKCKKIEDVKKLLNPGDDNIKFVLFNPIYSNSIVKFWRNRELNRQLVLAEDNIININTKRNLEAFINKLKGKYYMDGEWRDNPDRKALDAKFKQNIRDLIDTLMGHFFSDKPLNAFKITFNGIWRYLTAITSEYNINITVDDVNLIIRLCTPKAALSSRPKLYTKSQKLLLSGIGISQEIVKGKIYLEGRSLYTQMFEMLSGSYMRMEPHVILQKLIEIFDKANNGKYKDALAKIDEIILEMLELLNGSSKYKEIFVRTGELTIADVDEDDKHSFATMHKDRKLFRNIKKIIELALIYNEANGVNIDILTKFRQVIARVFEFNALSSYNKIILLNLISTSFPRILFRTFSYKSNNLDEKFRNFFNEHYDNMKAQIQEAALPLSGSDFINTAICNLEKLTIESFDNITSFDRCVAYDSTTIRIINGPILTGKLNEQINQLLIWYNKCAMVIINTVIDQEVLYTKLFENLNRLTVEALVDIREIALNINGWSSLEKSFKQILELSLEIKEIYYKKVMELTHTSRVSTEFISTLVLKYKIEFMSKIEQDLHDEAVEYIAAIMAKKREQADNMFLTYCKTHHPHQYFNAMFRLSKEERLAIFLNSSLNKVQFIKSIELKNKDLSNLCLVNVSLEEINSLEGCITNNNTTITLVSPFQNISKPSVTDIDIWIKNCLKTISTVENDNLLDILKDEMISLLSGMFYSQQLTKVVYLQYKEVLEKISNKN
ncbi:MAG: hypothetical protein ACK5Z5_05965 [Neisseriaceae bacterium]